MKVFLAAYAAVLGICGVISFVLYAADKIKAIRGSWRISEAALLSSGALFGAAGSLLAMVVCRHKTRHWYFWAANAAFLAVHLLLGVLICVFAF